VVVLWFVQTLEMSMLLLAKLVLDLAFMEEDLKNAGQPDAQLLSHKKVRFFFSLFILVSSTELGMPVFQRVSLLLQTPVSVPVVARLSAEQAERDAAGLRPVDKLWHLACCGTLVTGPVNKGVQAVTTPAGEEFALSMLYGLKGTPLWGLSTVAAAKATTLFGLLTELWLALQTKTLFRAGAECDLVAASAALESAFVAALYWLVFICSETDPNSAPTLVSPEVAKMMAEGVAAIKQTDLQSKPVLLAVQTWWDRWTHRAPEAKVKASSKASTAKGPAGKALRVCSLSSCGKAESPDASLLSCGSCRQVLLLSFFFLSALGEL
jgi:hypothetical protein